MIRAICINKIRDNRGNIKSYVLKDTKGVCVEMTSADLKRNIAVNSIDVLNLQIDKAGRLVDKAKSKTPATSFSEQDIKNFVDFIEHGEKSFPFKTFTKDFSVYEERTDNTKSICNITYGDLSYDSDGYPLVISNDTSEKIQKALDVLNALVRKVVNHVVRGEIRATRTSRMNFQVQFTDDIESIIREVQGDDFRNALREGLFRISGASPRIAYIRCKEDNNNIEYLILTNKYENIRKFLQEHTEQKSIKEKTVCSVVLKDSNSKGNAFYARYLAELQGKDLEYFKEQMLTKAISDYRAVPYKDRQSVREVLTHLLHSRNINVDYYLAINNNLSQNFKGDTARIIDKFYNKIIENEVNNMMDKYSLLFMI